MLTSKFETNRERCVSPTPCIYQSVGSRKPTALGCCYPRPNHDTLVCSNVPTTPQEVDKQHLRIEPRLSSLDHVQPLRIVGSPFQHDQCVGIDSLMPDGAASPSNTRFIFTMTAPPQTTLHAEERGLSRTISVQTTIKNPYHRKMVDCQITQ